MEKQEPRSKWDELARDLGAEIPPEAEQKASRQPVISVPPPPQEPAKPRVAPPKRAADWGQLSSELGLPPLPPEVKPAVVKPAEAKQPPREVPPPPAPRRQPEISAPPPAAPEPAERIHEAEADDRRPPRRDREREPEREPEAARERPERDGQRGNRRRGRRGGSGNREESPERGRSRDQEQAREAPRERETSREREAPREREAHRERETPRERQVPRERPVTARDDGPSEPRPEAPRVDPPKPAGGVSLWQKIFGAPAQPTAAPANDTTDRVANDRPRADGPRNPRDFVQRELDDSTTDESDVDRALDGDDCGPAGNDIASDKDAPEGRKRTRSRRGRGRGRGRTEGERQEARPAEPRRPASRRNEPEMLETPGADDFDDLGDDLDDDDFNLDASIDDDEGADENGDGVLAGEAAPTRKRTAAHRTIPSWDDAIGMIVETNMQSRSQRRPSGGPGGSGQRRPRGGRRRGGGGSRRSGGAANQ